MGADSSKVSDILELLDNQNTQSGFFLRFFLQVANDNKNGGVDFTKFKVSINIVMWT
jgi:hypothetical protein